MGFVVALSCPQCGGTIECDEADHFLRCPYCNAGSFVYSRDFFRYVLPWKQNYETLVFVPYLRFRGAVYFCKGVEVDYRVVDVSHLGVPFNILPATLGLRPQAMKIRFVDPEQTGFFLRCFLSVAKLLEKTGNQLLPTVGEKLYHRAYIGETMSLIYLPLAIMEDRVIDAVTDQQIARIDDGTASLTSFQDKDWKWKPSFLVALCPGCGSDLAGDKDSVAMLCKNCQSVWEAGVENWVHVESRVFPAVEPPALYLPFWAMTVQASGVEINSYADFLRASNQPRVVRQEWEQREIRFWTPAFKINPKIFLRLSSQLTIIQPDIADVPALPQGKVFPVTLPKNEAVQALKIILANSSVNKKDIMPRLPDTQFSVKSTSLVYLPFLEQSHEFFQEKLGLQINRQSLDYGRLL